MARPRIKVDKTQSQDKHDDIHAQSDRIQEMEGAINKFCDLLEKPSNQFDPEKAFDVLLKYVSTYERILYSTISNRIYHRYDEDCNIDIQGTVLSNLDDLVEYSENAEKIAAKKKALTGRQTEQDVDDTRKALIKIWDHVSLAIHQYTMLKQTDDEYDEKFKMRISSYKEEMSKDMNSQMITMVSIFTALAFLIFGSISSLDGIFENVSLPLFKTLSISLIWGICVSNMIFVFLYCIGKMTKLNFKATTNTHATIFEKYPVVWWTNLTLVSLLLISLWGWFIQTNAIGDQIHTWASGHPVWTFAIGCLLILGFVVIGIILLTKNTKNSEADQ